MFNNADQRRRQKRRRGRVRERERERDEGSLRVGRLWQQQQGDIGDVDDENDDAAKEECSEGVVPGRREARGWATVRRQRGAYRPTRAVCPSATLSVLPFIRTNTYGHTVAMLLQAAHPFAPSVLFSLLPLPLYPRHSLSRFVRVTVCVYMRVRVCMCARFLFHSRFRLHSSSFATSRSIFLPCFSFFSSILFYLLSSLFILGFCHFSFRLSLYLSPLIPSLLLSAFILIFCLIT